MASLPQAMGTASLVEAAGQFVVVTFLVYFLLVSGDTFRRSLLRVSGDTLTKKKITLQILDEIDLQIQKYLLVQLVTSALLGAICWTIFVWIGLQDALVWGALGGILHLIPYIGPTAFVVITAVIAFVQFDTMQPVVIVAGSVLTIVGLIGMLLVPCTASAVRDRAAPSHPSGLSGPAAGSAFFPSRPATDRRRPRRSACRDATRSACQGDIR